MPSVEERLAALERDNTELKRQIELHTLALSGLVNKGQLERLNTQNDMIFKSLSDHDKLTNMQLAELREHVEVQLEGKVTGLQTEMRQRFDKVDARFEVQQADIATLKIDVTTLKADVTTLKADMTTVKSQLVSQGDKLDQVLALLTKQQD